MIGKKTSYRSIYNPVTFSSPSKHASFTGAAFYVGHHPFDKLVIVKPRDDSIDKPKFEAYSLQYERKQETGCGDAIPFVLVLVEKRCKLAIYDIIAVIVYVLNRYAVEFCKSIKPFV